MRLAIKSISTMLASLALAATATAMPISAYDRLTQRQKANYDKYLVSVANDYLQKQGTSEDAKHLAQVFGPPERSEMSQGMTDFREHLTAVRKFNAMNATNPGFQLDVEAVFARTLKQYGISVPLPVLTSAAKDYAQHR